VTDPTTAERPVPEKRTKRGLAIAFGGHGLVAALGWLALSGHALENGGVRLTVAAIVANLGYVVAASLLWRKPNRWRGLARYYAILLVVSSLVWQYFAARPGVIPPIIILSAIPLLLLTWGKPSPARRNVAFAGVGLVTVLFLVGAGVQLSRPPRTGSLVVAELMRVDDDLEPPAVALTFGFSIETETLDGRPHRFLQYATNDEPSVALRHVIVWTNENVHPPEGVHLGWERNHGGSGAVLHSHWLREPPFMTSVDVRAADVVEGSSGFVIIISMDPAATDRLREVTRQNIGKRIALEIGGGVQSVASVRAEITKGPFSLTLGPDWTKAEAESLAAGVRGEWRYEQ